MQDTLFQAPVAVDSTITTADLAPAAPAAADTAALDLAAETGEAVATMQGLVDGFFGALPKVVIAVVVVLLFVGIAKAVRGIVHRVTPGPIDSSIGIVLGRLAYAFMITFGLFVGLTVVVPSLTFASLAAGLGISGIVIGFAFQDIFQNLLAGILILLREPFRTGDEIVSGDYVGTVESIETRATFIRTYDGKRVIIPNSQIYQDPVQVITAYDMVRSEYDVGIGYGDDITEAKRIALATLREVEGVLPEPAPDVLVWELAGSSVNLRLRWWTKPTRGGVVETWDRVLQTVATALVAAGIDLPFPTQQILFHDQTEATDGDRRRQREGWPAPPEGDVPEQARIVDALRQRDAGRA